MPRTAEPVINRLMRYRRIVDSGCWEWTGHIGRNGYGQFRLGRGHMTSPHRAAYEALVGPIPEGLQLDHLCRNKSCFNPSHLEPVTGAENIRRRAAAVTHCCRGHEFTPENTRKERGSHRRCKTCQRAEQAAYRARKADAA